MSRAISQLSTAFLFFLFRLWRLVAVVYQSLYRWAKSTDRVSVRGFLDRLDARVRGSSGCSRIRAEYARWCPGECLRFALATHYTKAALSLTTMASMLYPNRQPALCPLHTRLSLLPLAPASWPTIKQCRLLLAVLGCKCVLHFSPDTSMLHLLSSVTLR